MADGKVTPKRGLPRAVGPNFLNLDLPPVLSGVIKCTQVSWQGLEKLSQSVSVNVESLKLGVEGCGGAAAGTLSGLPLSVAGCAGIVGEGWGTSVSSTSKAAAASDGREAHRPAVAKAAVAYTPGSLGLSSGGRTTVGDGCDTETSRSDPWEGRQPSAARSRPGSFPSRSPTSNLTVEASMLSLAIRVLRQSLENRGCSSDWLPLLELSLQEPSSCAQVRAILAAHGWYRSNFGGRPPSREALLRDLEVAAKATPLDFALVNVEMPSQEDGQRDYGDEYGRKDEWVKPTRPYSFDDDGECCRRWMPTCAGFPCCLIHCPFLFASLVVALMVLLMVALWPGVTVETSLDSFLQADGEANDIRNAWNSAIPSRGSQAGRRLQGSVLHKVFNLNLMYRAPPGQSVFGEGMLSQMRDVEVKLKGGPLWRGFCDRSGVGLRPSCDYGVSLINYAWPEQTMVGTETESGNSTINVTLDRLRYTLSGLGGAVVSLDEVWALVAKQGVEDILFPKGYVHGPGEQPEYLRSHFDWAVAVYSVEDPPAERTRKFREITNMYQEFLTKELYPTLVEAKSTKLEIVWDGDSLSSQEIFLALTSDTLKAIGSAVFIVVYLTLHTGSPLLSCGAIFLSMLSIPVAFVLAAAISGSNRVTGASFLSLFFIAGFGADVAIVFITFWDCSKDLDSRAERVKSLYLKAGTACLATSVTTAASFFSNLASVLRPLREFGFFMGLCIMGAYLLLFAVYPAFLILNEKLGKSFREHFGSPEGSAATGLMRLMLPHQGGTDTAKSSRSKDCMDGYMHRFLVPLQRPCCCLAVIMPIILTLWIGKVVKVSGELPQMFPEGHNGREVETVKGYFTEVKNPREPSEVILCPANEDSLPDSACALSTCSTGVTDWPTPIYVGEAWANGSYASCSCRPTRPPRGGACYMTSYRADAPDVRAGVSVRFLGLKNIPDDFWFSDGWKDHVRLMVAWSNGVKLGNVGEAMAYGTVKVLDPMIQEHWESGTVWVTPYLQGPYTSTKLAVQRDGPVIDPRCNNETLKKNATGLDCSPPLINIEVCDAVEMCYCGTPVCQLHGRGTDRWSTLEFRSGRRLSDADPPGAAAVPPGLGPRSAAAVSDGTALVGLSMLPDRRLQAAGATTDISMVFGIVVTGGMPLLGDPSPNVWKFNDAFYPEDPRVQRLMLRACVDSKADDHLAVYATSCWLEEFREWLLAQGDVFPVPSVIFKDKLQTFAETGVLQYKEVRAADQMWFDASGNLKACNLDFDVKLSYTSTRASVILEYMKRWNVYTAALNTDAPSSAGLAWHTSRLWLRAEAEKAIVASTLGTMLLSVAFGFMGAMCSTRCDVWLSTLVVWSVVGVIICLAWFMVAIMGWGLGPIEVLGLIVFVGYSITYALHIAHKYKHHVRSCPATERGDNPAKLREDAVEYALSTMCSAVMGSALTTLGSSLFLFFCTMVVFVKLAVVLFVVTTFAAIFALLTLPAMLLACGPTTGCLSGVREACRLLSPLVWLKEFQEIPSRLMNKKPRISGLRGHGDNGHDRAGGGAGSTGSGTPHQTGRDEASPSRPRPSASPASGTAATATNAASKADAAAAQPRGSSAGSAPGPGLQTPGRPSTASSPGRPLPQERSMRSFNQVTVPASVHGGLGAADGRRTSVTSAAGVPRTPHPSNAVVLGAARPSPMNSPSSEGATLGGIVPVASMRGRNEEFGQKVGGSRPQPVSSGQSRRFGTVDLNAGPSDEV
mmetsp:Transcript_10836/g.37989  ORF Transcript_10836/g.37989 Transcript_10836/m.37989 type:complete len:1733 (-) Transcript_10836:105-5303(-)